MDETGDVAPAALTGIARRNGLCPSTTAPRNPTKSSAAESKPVEELTREPGDALEILVHRKMASLEQMYLRLRHVRGVGGRPRHGKGWIVLAPKHQGGRAPLPKISLPSRIGGDVVPIIIEQLGLDVRFAGTVQKCELVGPGIRIIEFGTRAPADMPGFCRLERQKTGAQLGLVGGAIGPERP